MIIKQGKTNIKYLFIVIVLAVFVGGGIFFGIELMKCSYWLPLFQQILPAEDETADWKTYRNTKYNYQLKAPQDFWNKAKPSAWVDSSNDDRIYFYRGHQWYIAIDYFPDASFYNPPLGTELVGWLEENKMLLNGYQTLDKPNFEIGGIPAVKMYSPGRPQAFNADIIYFIKDNRLFQIQALADIDSENDIDIKDVKEICDQMLSTFRFVEPVDTFDWKTYRNEEYGFEFKYPSEWETEEPIIEEASYWKTYGYEDIKPIFYLYLNAIQGFDRMVSVEVYNNLRKLSIEEWCEEWKDAAPTGDSFSGTPEEVIVDGARGLKGKHGCCTNFPLGVFFTISGDDKVYNIDVLFYNIDVPFEEKEAIFIQMLSTFKFIEVEETSDWQTYRNEEYGFEIKYPKDWKVAKNIFSFEPNLVFCPFNLIDPDPEVVCELKTGATKPQYEEGMIYLFVYNSDPKSNNLKYHYLGFVNGKYYYLYSEDNESIVNQILSTFRFLE